MSNLVETLFGHQDGIYRTLATWWTYAILAWFLIAPWFVVSNGCVLWRGIATGMPGARGTRPCRTR